MKASFIRDFTMEKMWKELAPYYDLMYSWKSYRKESERILSLVRQYKTSPGKELLDVACGTGGHVTYLRRHFRVTGTDVSDHMLSIARKKNPGTRFLRQNMMSLTLPGEAKGVKERFDVIVCLFASIAYTRTYVNLRRALSRFSEHLRQGGIVIIDPFVSPRDFKPHYFDGLYVDRPEIKLCRIIKTRLQGNIATLDCHFLLATKEGVSRFHDVHRMGCFREEKFLKIMRECGLHAKFVRKGLMPGRGLYVGMKT